MMDLNVVNIEMENRLKELRAAIKSKNKKRILYLYEEINLMDFIDGMQTSLLDEYDELTGQGNDILYS